MKLKYAQKKRLKSLATRFLHQYDNLTETKDVNQHYLSDFNFFMEEMLVDLCGYKKEEKPNIHRPRKVGQRPPRRKKGERPPRIGEIINKPNGQIAKHDSTDKAHQTISPRNLADKPAWYKKVWRKVMLAVHPDRVDLLSKGDMDKFERIRVSNRLSEDASAHLLIASAHQVDVDIDTDISIYEQERILRISSEKIKKELLQLQQGVPWVWGESFVDSNIRMQVIKLVMENSGLIPPPSNVILEYLSRKEKPND